MNKEIRISNYSKKSKVNIAAKRIMAAVDKFGEKFGIALISYGRKYKHYGTLVTMNEIVIFENFEDFKNSKKSLISDYISYYDHAHEDLFKFEDSVNDNFGKNDVCTVFKNEEESIECFLVKNNAKSIYEAIENAISSFNIDYLNQDEYIEDGKYDDDGSFFSVSEGMWFDSSNDQALAKNAINKSKESLI